MVDCMVYGIHIFSRSQPPEVTTAYPQTNIMALNPGSLLWGGGGERVACLVPRPFLR